MASFTDFFTSLSLSTDSFKEVFDILKASDQTDATEEPDADGDGFKIGGIKIRVGQTKTTEQAQSALHTDNEILGNDLFNTSRATTIVEKMLAGEEIDALDFLE